jgi:hypothetical protein
LSEEEVLDRIDLGDIQGFLDEAEFEAIWLRQLIAYFPYLPKSATKATRKIWLNTIEKGKAKWGV